MKKTQKNDLVILIGLILILAVMLIFIHMNLSIVFSLVALIYIILSKKTGLVKRMLWVTSILLFSFFLFILLNRIGQKSEIINDPLKYYTSVPVDCSLSNTEINAAKDNWRVRLLGYWCSKAKL